MATDELEYTMIEIYRIELEMINIYVDDSDNELALSEFNETWFRYGKKSYKSKKCNEVYEKKLKVENEKKWKDKLFI